ncbi:MAG TPA: hypothetical protein VLL98_06000 [Rickettsiales bacterium]|nr:hypothetical protein [Rickettsiales bacterium]
MNEIGNYFGLETANLSIDWLKDKVGLNSGRNALRYIVRAYQIKKIYVPAYTCAFVWSALEAEKCELIFYHVDKNFMPVSEFGDNDFILYNNYFGVCGKQVKILHKKYKNLIIDNTQALYSLQKGLASFFSLRKFFGVPDGGLAWCDKKLNENFETAVSYHLCTHLLKIYDKGIDAGYINFIKNEVVLDSELIKKMSNLTRILLKNVNYEKAKQIRLNNFKILHEKLATSNELKLDLAKDDVPMIYPYVINNETLRKKMEENKIFLIPCWPDIDKHLSNDELYLKKYLLTLPLDQRYKEEDMKKILTCILFS